MSSLTVQEYSKYIGKDEGNIRRMLINGRLKGTKIGKQWFIDENELYPEDKRIITGKYKNWRKFSNYRKDKKLVKALENLVDDYVNIYNERIEKIILYGSYARGTQKKNSDVDIALILNAKPTKKMEDKQDKQTIKYEMETNKVLSVIDIELDKYNDLKQAVPFYKNIDKEGIVLWLKE